MASNSCLRIKPGLQWDIEKRIPYNISVSPEFTLLNSTWNVMIDIGSERNREISDMNIKIILRNLSDFQPYKPFEVTTFLHDKKTGIHMKCSTMDVTSRDVTLYRFSYYAIAKKLPEFDMTSGLIVLFLFSESVESSLKEKRDYSPKKQGSSSEEKDDAPKSYLSVVPCLIWESEMPRLQKSQMSPVFSLLNSLWKLEIALTISDTAFHSAYKISLKSFGSLPAYVAIEILTFLYPKEYDVSYRLLSTVDDAGDTPNTRHKARFESVPVDAYGFELCNDITVISIFNHSTGLALIRDIQIDELLIFECPRCQDKECWLKEGLNPVTDDNMYSQRPLLNNIMSLSNDLNILLENPYLSDVQLQCGENCIPAHKVILAARSPAFKDIISKDAGNLNKNQTIIIDNIEPLVFPLFLIYLYSGKLPDTLSEETIFSLYRASTAYEVKSLQTMCRCCFVKNLRRDNCVKLMLFALANSDTELMHAFSRFVIENPIVMQSVSYGILTDCFPQVVKGIYRMYLKHLTVSG